MSTNEQLNHVQGLMVFLASVSNGLEDVLGRGASGITFRAGKTASLARSVGARKADDLLGALDVVWTEMCGLGMRWAFEPYLPEGQTALVVRENGREKLHLVFRNCMVRCALFRYAHPQRLSLCMMNHGLFCGLVERVTGGKASLDVLHAGENACLKVLTVER